MREIEFRLYDKVNNFMVYPSKKIYINMFGKIVLESMDDGEIIEANENDYELMQYTGLKDKNDKEIYEGDIVEFNDVGEEGYEYKEGFDFINRALVIFEQGRFVLDEFIYFDSGVVEELNNHEELIWTFENSKIIGNIFENPELLEVEDEN